MRRLVLHAIAGAGVSAVAVAAVVSGLAGPSQTTLTAAPALPLTTTAPSPSAASSASPSASATPSVLTSPSALDRRTTPQSRDELRPDLSKAAAATRAATQQRRRALTKQQKAIATQQAALKKKAARQARQKAEAKAERERAIKAAGYEPGTTDPREMAKQILKNKFDYPASEFSCFDNIIMRESMWDVHATNRSSGAYGIPQSLPGNKMATVASDWRTNPATQIIWGVTYMKGRYGSPCAAWGFKRSHGWY